VRIIREWVDRLLGALGSRRRDDDLEEELRSHLALAADDAARRGDTAPDAARAARLQAGGISQAMDAVRDQRGLPWLAGLTSDLVCASRQLMKHRIATVAAVLSLGLAVGATSAAVRLVDAVLLRTLPVAEPERLFAFAFTRLTSRGEMEYSDDFDYPTYRRYAEAIGDRAQVMVVGTSSPQQIAFGDEFERAFRQYISGNVFPTLGLQPAVGRLLGPADDVIPGGHPVAVISHEYWTRRFAQDPTVVGRTFRWGRSRFEIVGVAPPGFTGTEPGRITDFFVPAVMNADALDKPGWTWFRLWMRPAARVTPEQVRQLAERVYMDDHKAAVKTFAPGTPRALIDAFLAERLQLIPAGTGTSAIKRNLRRPLLILTALVALVLFIACANVANLLSAQSVARAREMALRTSIGAGRWRLIRLALIESALLALMASVVGAAFSWWAAPFVVSLVQLDQPVRLILDIDWRTLGFGAVLAIVVTFVFGVAPARRAASVDPLRALKGDDDPHAHRRLTRTLIGAQMALCMFVLFAAGLFVATFARLSNQPLGFSHERLLVMEAMTSTGSPRAEWLQLVDRIRGLAGVESAALAGWAPLSGNGWSAPVRIAGRRTEDRPPYFIDVSPGYFAAMHIEVVDGRDFQQGDQAPRAGEPSEAARGVVIVNKTFARLYFGGDRPIGRQVVVGDFRNAETTAEIVGVVGDAVYRTVRDPAPPTVYVPLGDKLNAAVMLRTTNDPLPLVPALRQAASRSVPDIRIRDVATQSEYVRRQLVLERLVALLSSFFAVLAILLSSIGLYGVLNYAVVKQRREIGIRMALGASAAHVVRRVTAAMITPVGVGLLVGLTAGVAFGRMVEQLLFHIKATDVVSFAIPLLTLGIAAALASLPPAVRAIRTDPAQTLRAE